MKASNPIDTSAIMNGRDILDRIERLTDDLEILIPEEKDELEFLTELAAAFDHCSDWRHGEIVIPEPCFTDYIQELIDDCYEMPENMGEWPYRHMTLDIEEAADEAKCDYSDCTINGTTYYSR